MRLTLALIGTIAAAAPAGLSLADDASDYDRRRAGTKGHVTAYEADGVTIIDVDACPNGYSVCGGPFRDSIQNRLCAKHGTGRHSWFYQIGDSKKISNSANCKGGGASGGGASDATPSNTAPASAGGGGDADEYDRRRAGTKNHVTAYEADRVTIIDVDACPSGYSACGGPFRESIKGRLCRKYGPGKHSWYYQVGDSSTKIANTAICK
jgi:hypothetical protein